MPTIRNDIMRSIGDFQKRQLGPAGQVTEGDMQRLQRQRQSRAAMSKANSPWKKGQSPTATGLKRTGLMQAPFQRIKQGFYGG